MLGDARRIFIQKDQDEELPGYKITEQTLELDTFEQDMVLVYTKLFIDTLRRRGHSTSNAGFRTAGSAKRALVWATRAQQFAAHSQLVDDSMPVDHEEIMTSITNFRIGAIRAPASTDKRLLA